MYLFNVVPKSSALHPANPLRRSPRPFTMLELLITMGVLVLVMAMLLPALNKSRLGAKKAQCVSNLKSMGTALNAYASISDEYVSVGDGQGGDTHRLIYLETDGPVSIGRYYPDENNAPRLYYCPVTLPDLYGDPDDGWKQFGVGDCYTSYYSRGTNDNGPVKLRDLDSQQAFLADYQLNDGTTTILAHGGNGVNALFGDGSVFWRPGARETTGLAPLSTTYWAILDK